MDAISTIPHFSESIESEQDMLRKPSKSEQTLAAIVNAAKEISYRCGLLNLTLNAVASRLDISKSGVFVRAGSLENLQILVLESYEKNFVESVYEPAMLEARGLPRLNTLMERWMECSPDMKALIISHYSATAYEDDTHSVTELKARLTQGATRWRDMLAYQVRQAVDEGHLRSDTDPGQLVFELSGMMSGYMYDTHRRQDPLSMARIHRAYARLMSTYLSFPDGSTEGAHSALSATMSATASATTPATA